MTPVALASLGEDAQTSYGNGNGNGPGGVQITEPSHPEHAKRKGWDGPTTQERT